MIRLVLVAITVAILMFYGISAQDVGIATTVNSETAAVETGAVATVAPDATLAPAGAEPAASRTTSDPLIVTEAVTIPPAPTVAPTIPVTTETAATNLPMTTLSPPTSPSPGKTVPSDAVASTDPTNSTIPAATPDIKHVASDSSASTFNESPRNTLRKKNAASSASSILSSSRNHDADSSASASSSFASPSKSVIQQITGTLEDISLSKIVMILILVAIGIFIVMTLLCNVCRSKRSQPPNFRPSDSAILRSPAGPTVMPTASNTCSWKATRSTFAAQKLPQRPSTVANPNANTRTPSEYDRANKNSHIASLPAQNSSILPLRQTNTSSSDQNFSIRGYSDFSLPHDGDSSESFRGNERYSTAFSMSDRYSTSGRFSTSSRLSSDPGRSNSEWFRQNVPKSFGVDRFSSTSSTASSLAARKHHSVSFTTQGISRTRTPTIVDNTISRTDIPDWYRVIESPTDNDRYTTLSLASENMSGGRDSFEL